MHKGREVACTNEEEDCEADEERKNWSSKALKEMDDGADSVFFPSEIRGG